ncbi:MAG: MoxR family ATPase [Verrucomicrobia bacterium]|nr:MoxR family ATPase [Verrucomicrobiota bacterium]
MKDQIEALIGALNGILLGKEDAIKLALACLFARGHLLIEDLPGVGKTTLAYSLARSLDCEFSRIQFTSDLLPSDVIGVSIYDDRIREFVFKQGPIFSNIVLADEINRTTPKTQSSLLEVMDRGKVSVDGQTYSVGEPFMVIATQNPVDYEGTFPLPDSQMDRFLMRLHLGYPDFESELEILSAKVNNYDDLSLESVVTPEELNQCQKGVREVYVEDTVLHYLVKIVGATRTETEFRHGISPRGALALKAASQARALFYGRDFVIPEDVFSMAIPIFVHRLALKRSTSDPLEERRVVSSLLRSICDSVPQPI